jgi:protein TonB
LQRAPNATVREWAAAQQHIGTGVALILAVAVNIALFLFIHYAISGTRDRPSETERLTQVDYIRVAKEAMRPELETPRRQRPSLQRAPQLEVTRPTEAATPEAKAKEGAMPGASNFPTPHIEIPTEFTGGAYLGPISGEASRLVAPPHAWTDDDHVESAWAEPGTIFGEGGTGVTMRLLPLQTFPPQYPPRALKQGIEGIVLVEFIVTKTGSVRNPIVVNAEPKGIFEEAALMSIRRWKFKPQMENGKPVERRARQKIRFIINS